MKLNLIRQGDWRRLLVDTLVVLIGVLAALVLNNVREDVVAERAARVATVRLIQEVEQNAEELRNIHEEVERRLSLLRELREQLPADKSLRDLVGQFHGYSMPELNASSWEYLSRSALADAVDSELLQEAFALYSINKHFDRLNEQIQDIVYSELFVSPDKTAAAIDISETIMWQQLLWMEELLPKYEQFLSRYSAEPREGEMGVDLK
ncbi:MULTISPECIES: hypothetical protein [unclassified Microbulbifer]|uniref:hypothetical protein n=1 Tax=unclassified Microbulbifer TaxID=2619833 RepID=UPI0027E4C080|nr:MULTISPECIES: hypothetical protein [unclassified Microbulbifer]